MSEKEELYKKLFVALKRANPTKSKKQSQDDCINFWNQHKRHPNLQKVIKDKIQQLEDKESQRKNLFKSLFNSSSSTTNSAPVQQPSSSVVEVEDPEEAVKVLSTSGNDQGKFSMAPKQVEMANKVNILKSELYSLQLREQSGLLTDTEAVLIKQKRKELAESEKKFKMLKANAARVKEHRDQQKRKFEDLKASNPEILESFSSTTKKGRPTIIRSQPDLLSTIIDIATFGAAASDKRRNDILRSIRTLDELLVELRNRGIDVGRSTVYYHLQAKNPKSIDGKKHIETVPVRLKKAMNDIRRSHPDRKFCSTIIHNIFQLASFLGPSQVSIISQDDKAKVPLGVTAAKTQTPILMHMEYQVRLPDHDFAVAHKHKLTPSVYAALEVQSNGYGDPKAVTYSGPTYIAIRSLKHSPSTSFSHAIDFNRLKELENFEKFLKLPNGESKPVFIQLVDGGPDQNPRYQKTIDIAIDNFVKNKLDALFIATNAPGCSAFNPVERRMAPLSKELSGVILPHEEFGSHLKNGQTVDKDLELKNFEHAGSVLAEIFSNVTIDGHATVAEYIKPAASGINQLMFIHKDEQWKANHIRSSQYFLQIVKCHDIKCCIPNGNYLQMFPHRFLPALIPLSYEEGNLRFKAAGNEHEKFSDLYQSIIWSTSDQPYDLHLPSIQNQLEKRTCKDCGLYVASREFLNNHIKDVHRKSKSVSKVKPKRIISQRNDEFLVVVDEEPEWINEENVEGENLIITEPEEQTEVPVISLEAKMYIPWENV
jgi:hypothetical protein